MLVMETTPSATAGKAGKKPYAPPKLSRYGELRDLAKGRLALSYQEGFFQDKNPSG